MSEDLTHAPIVPKIWVCRQFSWSMTMRYRGTFWKASGGAQLFRLIGHATRGFRTGRRSREENRCSCDRHSNGASWWVRICSLLGWAVSRPQSRLLQRIPIPAYSSDADHDSGMMPISIARWRRSVSARSDAGFSIMRKWSASVNRFWCFSREWGVGRGAAFEPLSPSAHC